MRKREFESHRNDRRKNKRYGIQAPAIVRIGKRKIRAFTSNISASGALLKMLAEHEFPEVGDTLDLTIKLPPVIRAAIPSFIAGRGRIVRTDERHPDETAIAVEMFEFAIRRVCNSAFHDFGEDNDAGMHDNLEVAKPQDTEILQPAL
jgi:hypothetical protein